MSEDFPTTAGVINLWYEEGRMPIQNPFPTSTIEKIIGLDALTLALLVILIGTLCVLLYIWKVVPLVRERRQKAWRNQFKQYVDGAGNPVVICPECKRLDELISTVNGLSERVDAGFKGVNDRIGNIERRLVNEVDGDHGLRRRVHDLADSQHELIARIAELERSGAA